MWVGSRQSLGTLPSPGLNPQWAIELASAAGPPPPSQALPMVLGRPLVANGLTCKAARNPRRQGLDASPALLALRAPERGTWEGVLGVSLGKEHEEVSRLCSTSVLPARSQKPGHSILIFQRSKPRVGRAPEGCAGWEPRAAPGCKVSAQAALPVQGSPARPRAQCLSVLQDPRRAGARACLWGKQGPCGKQTCQGDARA